MANLKLKNPAGGSLNFVSADSASDLTVTFPAVTGTAMVSGNMPAFSAFGNSSYSATSGVDTKVRFNNERFDTANCFDPTTNFRFTPNVAGYYQINYTVRFQIGSSFSIAYTMLFKNGSVYAVGNQIMNLGAGTIYMDMPASDLVYMNGTTDYLEVYVNIGATTITINDSTGTGFSSLFSGCLVREA
jgi:hypothetical protein